MRRGGQRQVVSMAAAVEDLSRSIGSIDRMAMAGHGRAVAGLAGAGTVISPSDRARLAAAQVVIEDLLRQAAARWRSDVEMESDPKQADHTEPDVTEAEESTAPPLGYGHRAHQPDATATYVFDPGPPRTLPLKRQRRWRVSG